MVKLKVDARKGFIFPSGVRTEPLYGYRFWDLIYWRHIDSEKFTWGLGSVTYKGVWTRPILRNKNTPITFTSAWGRDTNYRHKLGYFTWSIEVVDRTASYNTFEPFSIIGRISLFGTVVTHERGFRSQNVKIDELLLIPQWMTHPGKPELWFDKGTMGYIDLATDDPIVVRGKMPEKERVISDLETTYDCEVKEFPSHEKAFAYLRYMHEEITGAK